MRYLVGILTFIILVAIQSSVIPQVRLPSLFSGQPNLVFLVVLCWAVKAPYDDAIFWAFVGGILQDLMSVLPLGTSVIVPLLLIYAIKWIEEQLFSFNVLLLLPLTLFGTLLYYGVVFVVLAIVNGYMVDFLPTIRYFVLPTLFYHLVLILPLYGIVRLLQGRIASPSMAA